MAIDSYTTSGESQLFPFPVKSTRAPTTLDIISSSGSAYLVGQLWINTVTQIVYSYAGGGIWAALGSVTGGVLSVTGDDSVVTLPNGSGNINLNGTANQITTTTETNGEVFSLSSTLVAPGSLTVTSGFTVLAGTTSITGTTNINTTGAAVTSIGFGGTGLTRIGNTTGNTTVTGTLTTSAGITATTGNITTTAGSITSATTLTATSGDITATNGNLVLGTAGNKLSITTGANASLGTSAALSSGTVTVSTTAVTASSKIFLTRAAAAGTLGNLSVGTITASTSFTITTDNVLDTSTINWLIIN